MSNNKRRRAVVAGGGVALSALTGLFTNIVTSRASWTVGAVVVVLVIAGIAVAIIGTTLESSAPEASLASLDRGSEAASGRRPPSRPRPSAVSQHGTGNKSTQIGGDATISTGMPGGYVVLSLAVVAASAVGVLLVALRFAPSASPVPTLTNTTTATTVMSSGPALVTEDLRYEITAAHLRDREVRISATPHGQPEPGLTYWFFVEVDYGTAYIEYYPHLVLSGHSTPFDVQVPAKADLKFPRTGRIYGLTDDQSKEADILRHRSNSNKNDFFVKPPGQPVSDPVKLPF
ncbi:hypothetical protein [Mangrovihabitans endophyticus]|nr:hypothetical protein [Mangrovihabitans endophyticus]